MRLALRPGRARLAFAGVAFLLLVLIGWLALPLENHFLLVTVPVGLLLLAAAYALLQQAEARARRLVTVKRRQRKAEKADQPVRHARLALQ